MRTARNTLGGLLLVLASACGSMGGRAPAVEPTTVRVENQSRYDMTIYVVRDNGQRVRIGRVTSLMTASMRIPDSMVFGVTTLRFMADPLAGNRQPISNDIIVTPGEEIQMTIPPMQ